MRRPGLSTCPDARAACATTLFHSTGGSINRTPSAGLSPLISRTTSPITSIAVLDRGSIIVTDTRVPTGSHAAVSRHKPTSDTSRVRHTTTSPPSSDVMVACSEIRYRGARRDTGDDCNTQRDSGGQLTARLPPRDCPRVRLAAVLAVVVASTSAFADPPPKPAPRDIVITSPGKRCTKNIVALVVIGGGGAVLGGIGYLLQRDAQANAAAVTSDGPTGKSWSTALQKQYDKANA